MAIEQAGELAARRPSAPDGEAAGTRFNHFAERVLPTLKQLRAARKAAEALTDERVSPATVRIGRDVLEAIRSIDTILRTTGVYDLSELAALESDATRMNAACRVLDEVGERLRARQGDCTAGGHRSRTRTGWSAGRPVGRAHDTAQVRAGRLRFRLKPATIQR